MPTKKRLKRGAKSKRSGRLSAQKAAGLQADNILLSQQAAVAAKWIDQASANTKLEIQALQEQLKDVRGRQEQADSSGFSFTVRGSSIASPEKSSPR